MKNNKEMMDWLTYMLRDKESLVDSPKKVFAYLSKKIKKYGMDYKISQYVLENFKSPTDITSDSVVGDTIIVHDVFMTETDKINASPHLLQYEIRMADIEDWISGQTSTK